MHIIEKKKFTFFSFIKLFWKDRVGFFRPCLDGDGGLNWIQERG